MSTAMGCLLVMQPRGGAVFGGCTIDGLVCVPSRVSESGLGRRRILVRRHDRFWFGQLPTASAKFIHTAVEFSDSAGGVLLPFAELIVALLGVGRHTFWLHNVGMPTDGGMRFISSAA
ncbi:hypothetical protein [Cryptosporangium sp. NPDC048952]|uniref:hypothetical protein n=1 Tax=Cryptosporangium sp. NPDC048952 TaxID=3363961 RepID=UPI0037104AAF